MGGLGGGGGGGGGVVGGWFKSNPEVLGLGGGGGGGRSQKVNDLPPPQREDHPKRGSRNAALGKVTYEGPTQGAKCLCHLVPMPFDLE